MPIGTLIKSHTAQRSIFPSAKTSKFLDLLCDGGSRPNPGTALPLVADDGGFLPVPPTHPGTNHQAIYDAVDHALDHALHIGVSDLTIELVSQLVWGHLTGNGGCKRLAGRRDFALTKAESFASVTWKLVKPPFVVNHVTVRSTRMLRRKAAGAHAPLALTASGGTGSPAHLTSTAPNSAAPTSALRPAAALSAGGGISHPVPAPPGP